MRRVYGYIEASDLINKKLPAMSPDNVLGVETSVKNGIANRMARRGGPQYIDYQTAIQYALHNARSDAVQSVAKKAYNEDPAKV